MTPTIPKSTLPGPHANRRPSRRTHRERRSAYVRSLFLECLEPRLPLATGLVPSFSTYFGGSGNETISDMAVDGEGNTYVIGSTTSPDLADGSGPDSHTDRAFVAKFNSQGEIEYSTILGPTPRFDAGGFADSNGYAVEIGPDGLPFVVFQTFETGTTTLASGGLWLLPGEPLLVIAKLSEEGTPTFEATAAVLPKPGYAQAFDFGGVHLATDTAGAAYVTYSAFRETAGGGAIVDPYLTKVAPSGAIEFTQSLFETTADIAIDRDNHIYIASSTFRSDLPTTLGAWQKDVNPAGFSGSTEIWIAELDPTASELLAATYLGGSHNDTVVAIAVDPNGPGLVYLVGSTRSNDFPLQNPWQMLPGVSPAVGVDTRVNAFVTLIDLNVGPDDPMMKLLASTYLGGGREEYLSSVAIDAAGNVFVAGGTNSRDFPVANALQSAWTEGPTFNSTGLAIGVNALAQDLVLARFNATLSTLEYSTYLGGSGHDFVPQVAVDSHGDIHLAATSAGKMYNPLSTDPIIPTADFPLLNPLQKEFGGGEFNFSTNLGTDAVVIQFAPRGTVQGIGSRTTQGREFNTIVAQFTSPRREARTSDFTATIDWGDGTSSPGAVTQPSASSPTFLVYGQHRYDTPGAYPVTVKVESVAEDVISPIHKYNLSRFDHSQTGGSVTVDRTDPNRIFAAMSDERGSSVTGSGDNGGIVVATSRDAGSTWSSRPLGNDQGPSELLARGNPDVLFDDFGNLFLAYQGVQGNNIIIALSTDGGLTFDPSNVIELSPPGSTPDPQSPQLVGSPKLAFSELRNEIWVTFEDRAGDQIFAAGAAVTGLGQVGPFDLQAVTGAHADGDSDIAVGPDGVVAVIWDTFPASGDGDGILASFDLDGLGPAVFTLPVDVVTNVSDQEFATPAQRPAIGISPTLAWDTSDGPHRGRLYVAYVDLADDVGSGSGTNEPTVFTTFTEDHGATWSDPRRISLDTQFQSMFLPSIALDPRTGTIAVGWYGTYGGLGTKATTADFYVATSTDGERFSSAERVSAASSNALDSSLNPAALETGYGEAPGMAFYNGRLLPVWSDNSELDGENHTDPQFEVAMTIIGVIDVRVPPVAIRPLPIQAIAGSAFSGLVATFTHPDGGLRPQDFSGTVTIYWGDGGRSEGQVSQPGGPGTEFIISGSHVYSEVGAYPLWISVFDQVNRLDAIPVSNVNSQRGSQAEATIAIDPKDPNRVFAAGVHVNAQAPRGIPVATSDDGGVTWDAKTIADGTDGLPPSIGDPKVVFDEFGNLFLTYLTPDPQRQVIVLLSTNGGLDFTTLATFRDVDPADQPSIAVGPGEGGAKGSVWLTWERGNDPFQVIMAAGAQVHGLGAVGGFGQFNLAPLGVDGFYRNFGDIAVGPDGQVLVTYVKGVPGATAIGPAEIVAHLDPDGLGPLPFGPAILVSDVKIGSHLPIPAQASRTIDAEGNLAWDQSQGEHRGRVYLVYTDSPSVGSADTNIFLRYSDDNGLHWGEPIQVHDDDPLSQFLPSVAVDQSSGNVGVGWHTAIDSANVRTRFTATLSDDGGSTFRLAYIVSPGDSDATQITIDLGGQRFQYGDYTGLAFAGGVMQPIWADNSLELESILDPQRFDLASARIAVAEVTRTPLVVQMEDVEDVEGHEFMRQLATFTDPNGAGLAADYKATIDWGDGTDPEDGDIQLTSDGSFAVLGTHEYEHIGRYPLRLVIKGHRLKGEGSATAVIENAPLDLTSYFGTRVVRQTEFRQVVAMLTDGNRHSTAADFLVSIEWGDGSASLATLELQPGSGEEGQVNYFNVSGTHQYLSEQSFTINVSLLERATGATLASQGEVISGDPVLIVEPGQFLDIEALAGINTGDLVLVTFTRADDSSVPLDTGLGEYTATINWGDGQVDVNVGPFVTHEEVMVVGRHTYANPGQYFPYVTLADDSGGLFFAPLIAMVEPDVTAQTRTVGSGLVYNPLTDRFHGELTVTNASQSDISGPLYIVIHDLPSGVTLDSFTEVTGAGDPLFKVNQSRLSVGASLPPIPLVFSNPGHVPINYTVQVFDGIRAEPLGGAGVVFEPNRGQAPLAAEYIARGQGYSIGLATGQAMLQLNGTANQSGTAALIELVGANATASGRAIDTLPGVSNYFAGNVAITKVPHYGRVRYDDVYANIDVEYYGREGLLEYDWIVRPGADPDSIAFRFRGVDTLTMDQAGNLRLQTTGGELVQRAPVAYQFIGGQRREVAATYDLRLDGSVGFVIGQFDPSLTLVIDPVLVFSTYLGGSGIERALAVAVDAEGNTVVVGETGSIDFFTVNPLDADLNQADTSPFSLSFDAFVTKFDPRGVPIFSTYLGGGSPEFGVPGDTRPYSVALDSAGRIWVAGSTLLPAFPTTVVAPPGLPTWSGSDSDNPGGGFLTQLAPDGSTLVYSTVFRGPNPIFDVAVDDAGMVYAVTTGFALKLDPLTNTAPYVRFLGNGIPKGVAVDQFGQVYIAGFTNDPSFPIKNAIFPTLRTLPDPTGDATLRAADGFLTKLFADGRVAFSTFLGNSQSGSATDVALDPTGVIYVVGQTNSDDLLVPGAWQPTRKGDVDAFLLKLANDGSEVLYGTYLGGSLRDEVSGVAVDAAGRVYIGGTTQSLDFPATIRAHQPQRGGGFTDGFAIVFEPDRHTMQYLTYLGGSGSDEVNAVAVDAAGNASYVGSTTSPDMLTRTAAQTRLLGADAFLTRLLATDAGTLTLHHSPLTATEGIPFSGLVAFFESNGTETSDQFSAIIDWGDGLSSAGTITGNYLTGFQVMGTHLYPDVGAHEIYVTLRDSLGRTTTVTSTGSIAAGTERLVRYHVAIATAMLAGTQGLLDIQFNPGAIPGSPDVEARIRDVRLFGGVLGTSTLDGGASGSFSSGLVLQPTAALNRLTQLVTLGERIEFELDFAGPGLGTAGLRSFADVFAVQLRSAAGSASLLAADTTGSLLRIEVSPDGSTHLHASRQGVTAAAAGRSTVASAPINLVLLPFEIQEGLAFERTVATFTDGNPLENADSFAAQIDWGDGTPPAAGIITGGGGNFTVSGSHVYARLGSYPLTVSVTEPDGQVTMARGGKEIGAAVQFNSFSNGSFGASVGVPVQGDVNGDGILDVVVQGNTFVPSFAGPGIQILLGRGDNSFSLAGFVTTGQSPSQLAVADFNHDGKLDVAASWIVFGQSTVSLFLGKGDGSLQPAIQLSDLRNPGNLVAADVNLDGHADLLYTESLAPNQSTASNLLKVALGRGDGAFDAPVATAISLATHSVYVADMDGDLVPDVVLASAVSGAGTTLYFLRGTGSGTFNPAIPFFVATGVSRALAIADFNGDGRGDIAHVDLANLRVFLSNGDGSFALSATRASPSSASVAVGDFDRDGRPDVATGELESGNDLGRVRVFLGEGGGAIGPGVGYEGVSAPLHLLAGDYDKDGFVDLATSGNSTVISVIPSSGDGTFASAIRYAVGLSEPQNLLVPRSVQSGDVNRDGRADVVVVMSDGRIVAELGGGNGTFQPVISGNAGPVAVSGLLVDVNHDGVLDLVTANQGGDVFNDFSGVSVSLGLGDGRFANRQFAPIRPVAEGFTTNPEDIAAGDLNGDGHIDLVASIRFATAILFGNGDGKFGAPTILTPPSATGLGDASNRVAIGDMDGDSDLDLITLHVKPGGGAVAVWRNLGNGTFVSPLVRDVPLPDYFRGMDMTIGDLNGDNRIDVVISDVGSGNLALTGGVSVLLGVGDGSLALPMRLLTAPRHRPYQVLLADVSRDGRPEIVVLTSPNGFEGEVRGGVGIFSNRGDGTFDAVRFFDHGGNAAGIGTAGDFNGDGGADIVVPHRQSVGSSFSIIYAGEQSVLVSDAPVTVTGVNLNPRVGVPFSALAAVFVDDNPFGSAGDFTATIDWGDGQTSVAMIQDDPLGGFAVLGSHTYVTTGTFTTRVTITELGAGTHVGNATAQVSAVVPTLTATGTDIAAMAEIPFTGIVATFTDSDSNGSRGDFSAIVQWGDGATSPGVILGPVGGVFSVVGKHAYPAPGTWPLQVAIDSIGGSAALANGTVQVAVRSNLRPDADNDHYFTDEDKTLIVNVTGGLLSNDSDPDNDALSAVIIALPAHGTVTLAPDGSFAYTPEPDFFGSDQFTYVTSDGTLVSNIATVNITVKPVNDPPVAREDAVTLPEDSAIVINVLANDSVGDGAILPATVAFTRLPLHGTVAVDAIAGTIIYRSFADYFGHDQLRYIVSDTNGLRSNEAVVSIAIGAVNDTPVAVRDVYLATEDVALVVAANQGVLANDTDLEGDLLSAVLVANTTHGTLTLNPNGSFSYVPASEFSGSDSFQYRAFDGLLESPLVTVFLLVQPVNDPPVVAPLSNLTIDEGNQIAVAGSFSDADADDTWTASVDFGDGTGSQSLTLDGTAFWLTHTYSESGQFLVRVKVTDQSGARGFTQFQVSVQNLPPTVHAGVDQSASEGGVVRIAAVFADPGLLDTHTASIHWGDGTTSQPVAVQEAGGSGTIAANHVYADEGTYFVTLTAWDDDGASHSDTLTITVSNVAPIVVGGADVTIDAGQSVFLPALIARTTADLGRHVSREQVMAGSFLDPGVLDSHTAVVDWGDGTVESVSLEERTFGPPNSPLGVSGVVRGAHAYPNAGNFRMVITVRDGDGGMGSGGFLVIVNASTNSPPVATHDQALTQKNTVVTISVLANDSDSDGMLNAGSVVIVGAASHGTTSINAATGAVTYTPAANYTGPDSFTYKVQDNNGADSNTATVTITVNSPPVATHDQALTQKNMAVTISVLANDSDSDGTLNAGSVVIVGAASHGTTSVNATTGAVTYTPAANYTGPDSFTYKVQDTNGADSNTATVAITVNSPAMGTILAVGADAGGKGKAIVKVYGMDGALHEKFLAYDTRKYRGGVRVAVADVNLDGFPDVITVPGHGHAPLVKVFDGRTLVDGILGNARELTSFLAYGASFTGGVFVAVGDVLGDDAPDIVVSPEREGKHVKGPKNGGAEIRVFENRLATNPSVPFQSVPDRQFLAFAPETIKGVKFTGGATVALGDFNFDGKDEIVVGNGSGMGSTIRVFDVHANAATYRPLKEFVAFSPGFRGGVFVAAGDVNGDGVADIIVGAGQGGGAKVDVINGQNGNLLYRVTPPTGCCKQSAVRVAAKDTNGDGAVDAVFLGQSVNGRSNRVRRNTPLDATAVDFLLETDCDLGGGLFLG